jgi:ureidoglycolate lyase
MLAVVMQLKLQPATEAAFAPYGRVFAVDQGAGRAINAGTSRRIDLPAALDLQRDGGQPVLAVFEALAQPLAGPWTMLERHALGSQTFLPLRAARWVVLVAAPGPRPQAGTFAAFALSATQAITLHPGTWHHPLITLDPGRFLVLERGAQATDCDVVELDPPVTIVD